MTNKENKYSFEESIRRSLSSVEVAPSAALWDRVEGSLLQSKPSPFVAILRWGAAVAAVVAVTLLLSVYFQEESIIKGEQSRIAAITEFETIEALPIELQPVLLAAPHPLIAKAEAVEPRENIEVVEVAPDTAPTVEPAAEPATEPQSTPSASAKQQGSTTQRSYKSVGNVTYHKQHKKAPISLHIAGAAGASNVSISQMPMASNDAVQGPTRSPFVVLSSDQVEPDVISHRAPWSFAIGAAWEFAPRWSLESGLNYTYLASDISLHTDKSVLQELQFVGLPVRANYKIVDSRLFTLYAAAGAQVEHCVSAKWDKFKVRENPWHSSTDAALGAQYNINKLLGVYLEPQLQYYFTPTKLESVRTESPLNFSMRFGLRFNL